MLLVRISGEKSEYRVEISKGREDLPSPIFQVIKNTKLLLLHNHYLPSAEINTSLKEQSLFLSNHVFALSFSNKKKTIYLLMKAISKIQAADKSVVRKKHNYFSFISSKTQFLGEKTNHTT